MHSDQLRYLIALSQNPSMNIASEQLHITPSALSISIKNLENELHLRLLHRTSRGVTLTEEGRQVVRIAENFFNELKGLQTSIDCAPSPHGECMIYTVQGAVDDLLPKVICELYDHYPDIHVIVETAAMPHILQRVNDAASLDPHEIALIYLRQDSGQSTAIGENCTFVPLIPVRLLAQIHERFPIAHSKNPSLKTILSYPIIIYNPLHQPLEANPTLHMLHTIAKPQKVILESNYQIYQSMVQQGKGIGFDVVSPLLSLNPPVLENIHNILLKDCPILQLGYLVNNTRPLSEAAQIFLNALVDYVKSNNYTTS